MCVSPVTLRRERLGIPSLEFVPCGKCPECVKDNQNSFVIRSIEEQKKRGSMWFITLTYANDNVPVAFDEDGEIVDRDLVPIAKNPSKFRPRPDSFCDSTGLSENHNFDSERFDSDCGDIPSDIYCPHSDSSESSSDMPMEVFLGIDRASYLGKRTEDDMPLSVYYGQEDNSWKGARHAISEIEKESAFTVVDVVGDTGELPTKVYSLDNRDVQKWKKRCRRTIDYHHGRRLDFGYMICGEYGPRTHRPHYHGLLVGLSDEDVAVFKRDWERNYGYTCFKRISSQDTERVARYVSKYITKQKCLEDPNVLAGLVAKPHKITSNFYGLPTPSRLNLLRSDIAGVEGVAVMENPDDLSNVPLGLLGRIVYRISKSLKYKSNGKEFKLPRYFREKLFYVKDAFTGRYRQSALSNLVSRALVDRVHEDFIGKCREMASGYSDPDSYETYADVSRRVSEIERIGRLDRAQVIIENNRSALRKSRF